MMSHEQFQQCIEECLRCMVACNHCYTACLDEHDVAMMKECIRLDRQCAQNLQRIGFLINHHDIELNRQVAVHIRVKGNDMSLLHSNIAQFRHDQLLFTWCKRY